jgi:hypothetical protein
MNESRTPMRKPLAARHCSSRARSAAAGGLECGTLVLMLLLAWRGEAWAYIDPNAGGFIAQILAPLGAILLSLLFYCRRELRRFAKALRARLGRGSPAQTDERESGK